MEDREKAILHKQLSPKGLMTEGSSVPLLRSGFPVSRSQGFVLPLFCQLLDTSSNPVNSVIHSIINETLPEFPVPHRTERGLQCLDSLVFFSLYSAPGTLGSLNPFRVIFIFGDDPKSRI